MSPEICRIRPLPEYVINQIAAGEVIERPASVVKELVENSIDAGARRVDIELEDGGLTAIVVSDDGGGLGAAELPAALRRHWTSKLDDSSELATIATLGFRGEALASIAAVAHIEIISRRRGEPHGWRVVASPGSEPSAPVPHQGPVGTRIVVRELFYNVPPRKRFLKRGRTEYLHVQQLIRRIGFAAPGLTLALTQAGSRGLRLRAVESGDLMARWRALFGAALLEGATPVAEAAGELRITGWLGAGELASSQSDVQFFALNGRAIRDRQLAHAVRLAYGERLAAGRFPVYALALDLPADAADVNVHPGKIEVRFADLRTVHDFVHGAVRQALGESARQVPTVPGSPSALRESGGSYGHASGSSSPRGAPAPPDANLGQALALVDQRYLLALKGGAVFSLDLRAAWETVLAGRLGGEGATTRPLLIPERLPATLAGRLSRHATELERAGFDIDDLGPAGSVVRGMPTVLPPAAAGILLARLPDEVQSGSDFSTALARATAAALVFGQNGRPNLALLEHLERAAGAANVALDALLLPLTGKALRLSHDDD